MARVGPFFVCRDARVRNLDRAVRFYRALGLRPVAKDRMADGTKIVWLRDPATRQLLEVFWLSPRSPLYRPFQTDPSSRHALIFGVSDPDETRSRLRRLGGRFVRQFEESGVRLTFLRDPDGTWVELLSWADPKRRARRRPPLVALSLSSPRSRARAPRSSSR